MAQLVNITQQLLALVPLKLMIIVVLLSAVLLEWYPFSCFPMYSKFNPKTGYVFLTDENDQPIPVYAEFGVRSNQLRKIFRSRMAETQWPWGAPPTRLNGESESDAAKRTLHYITTARNPKTPNPSSFTALKLWRAEISIRDQAIEVDRWVAGRIEVE